jgi:hypothetical protein
LGSAPLYGKRALVVGHLEHLRFVIATPNPTLAYSKARRCY